MDELVPTRIELARPLPPLTYLAPAGVPPGARVKVKVRNGAAVGVVLGPDPDPPAVKLRPVEAVLEPFPLLPPRLWELLEFAARYYGCGMAHLLPLCLPQAVEADWETATPDGSGCATCATPATGPGWRAWGEPGTGASWPCRPCSTGAGSGAPGSPRCAAPPSPTRPR